VSVYSADVDSRCPSPLIGCRRLAAVLLDTSAALSISFVNKLKLVKWITEINLNPNPKPIYSWTI